MSAELAFALAGGICGALALAVQIVRLSGRRRCTCTYGNGGIGGEIVCVGRAPAWPPGEAGASFTRILENDRADSAADYAEGGA